MADFKYGELTVSYDIDSDVDGNHATITSIDGLGVDVDYLTLKDMEFIAESEFADLQTAHYMKTGETL
jgi:hypothetical protein